MALEAGRIQRIVVAIEPHIGMRGRRRESAAIAAAHRRDRIRGADQRRQRHVGGMRVADRVVLDRAQAKALRGVVGRLLQPAIVEHQRFGLAVFQEQLAIVGALQPPRDLVAYGIAVEIGAVEQGGCGKLGHQIGPLSEGCIQDSCFRPFREGRDQHVAETMDSVEIVPITQDHIESFHRALDFVARERRYLAFLEAPPLELTRAFVLNNIKHGYPQLVAVSAGQVVGWCDVMPQAEADLCPWRRARHGLSAALPAAGNRRAFDPASLAAAQAFGFHRVELTVRENNTVAIELYKKVGFDVEGVQRDAHSGRWRL